MRAAKIDANQNEIVDALRAVGASVQSLAKVGGGCPDLLVGWGGKNYLIEVKDGSGFTPAQKTWHRDWQGKAHVANNIEEAMTIITGWRSAA
jgi:hypothetical protein